MVLPALVLFFVFHTIPVLQGIYYSFTDSPGYGPYNFVGLSNYIALFTRPSRAPRVLVHVPDRRRRHRPGEHRRRWRIAVGLNGKIKCKTTLRGVYFIPNVLSVLVVGYIFFYLFSNSLPALGEKLGIDFLATSLLTKASTAWIGIVILAVWQAAAFNIIIYIAGLQTVPAGALRGRRASTAPPPWRQFRSITFPMIAGLLHDQHGAVAEELPSDLRPHRGPHRRRAGHRHGVGGAAHLQGRLPGR